MAVPLEVLETMRSVATMEPAAFVNDILLGTAPYAFRARPSDYDEFRVEVGARLSVDSAEIELVGSARLGFSLNPDHLLRAFEPSSDLDLVIVSSEVFDAAWQEMLINASSIALANEDEKRRLRKTRENFFNGYLRPDHVPRATFL